MNTGDTAEDTAEEGALRTFIGVAVALNGLRRRDDLAFAAAISMGRDPGHVPAAGSLPVLRGWGLLSCDGTMPDDTRAAVRSFWYGQDVAA